MSARFKLAATLSCVVLAAMAGPASAAVPGIDSPGLDNPSAPTNETLFFHVIGLKEFPINTQPPIDAWTENASFGMTTFTSTCAPPGVPGGYTGRDYHTWYGFSTPGFVEYNNTADGLPRYHPERGLSYDVSLAGDTIDLHWFLSTQTGVPTIGGVPDPNAAPVVVPNVVVRGTMRAGSAIGNLSTYDDGTLVAMGDSAPATLAAQATSGAKWSTVDGLNVYEIVVPMTIKQATIPRLGGYTMRVDTFMPTPQCDDPATTGSFMPNLVKVHTSKDHRPHMDLQVTDPLKIEYMHPQFIGDDVVLHASVNSVFGNYDVDVGAAGLVASISGPTPATSLYKSAVVQRYHEHEHHTEAVDVAFVWPYQKDDAAQGTYAIKLAATNLQHTATALGLADFDIGSQFKVTRCGTTNSTQAADGQTACVDELQDGQGNALSGPTSKSPASGVALLAAGVALAAIVRRRRFS
jgi:hypothetical protein